jgi:hypothetical protein
MGLVAAEMGFCSAVHQARAALTQLLQFREPAAGPARYPVPLRPPSTPRAALTTAAHCSGKVELARPGICVRTVMTANSASSPTRHRRPRPLARSAPQARCGGPEVPFDHRSAQMMVLAGLK